MICAAIETELRRKDDHSAMSVRFVRPVSRSAFLSRYFGLISLALIVLTFALHRIGMLSTPDFIAVQVVGIGFALAALLLALIGLRQLWVHGSRGGMASLQTLFFVALPLAVAGLIAFQYVTKPLLYDVSSDVEDVPQWIDAPVIDQKWLSRPSTVTDKEREAQRLAYPEFASHRYDGAIDRVYAAARKVAKSQKITITAISGMPGAVPDRVVQRQEPTEVQEDDGFEFAPDELPTNVPVPSMRPQGFGVPSPEPEVASPDDVVVLQAYMVNYGLGLPYNLVIRLTEDGQTTLVDIRMVADYGASDFGLGLWMAKSYLDALDAEMQGLNDL